MKDTSTTEIKLRERIKELHCLYAISSVIAANREYTESLDKIAEIVKNAWLHAEEAIVAIYVDGVHWTTGPQAASSVKLEETTILHNKQSLTIAVYYPSPAFSDKDFLEEEKYLLRKIALEIAGFLNGRYAKEQEELLQRGLQRNDRLAILGEITAGIAHELNTPLANILGFAELLETKVKDEDYQKDISKIIKSAMYAREVVKKLMFFTCEMPQNRTVQQVKPIIEEALSLLGPNLKKARVETVCNIADVTLKTDEIQFLQMLFNLMINALYVSPPNSKIYMDVYEKDNTILLEVADEGPGIPEEIKYKVFEPFFSTKPAGQGSGLGLSVVHGIVKSHGGNISIRDNTPKGAIFSIQLPKNT